MKRKGRWLTLLLLMFALLGIALLVRENSHIATANGPALAYASNASRLPPGNAAAFAAQALGQSGGLGNGGYSGDGRPKRKERRSKERANGTAAPARFAEASQPTEAGNGSSESQSFTLGTGAGGSPGAGNPGNGPGSGPGNGEVPAFLPIDTPGPGGVAVNVEPTSTPTTPGGVPEPETWAMIGLGFAMAAFAGKRRGRPARRNLGEG